MKTILFPTDFTDAASPALDWGQLVARQYGATLVLLHAQAVPTADALLPMAGDMGVGLNTLNTGLAADIEPLDRRQLTKMAALLQAEGIACRTEFRWGNVTDAILTTADEVQADLIVLGRSHLSNFFERLVGTQATGVARKAHCPVLIVPSEEAGAAQLRTMVFTTSLEFDQPAEFGQVVDLARAFGATVSVLHVHAENQPSMTDSNQMIAQLQQIFGVAELAVDTVAARTVTGGIETYLNDHHPDLLVMTNRERDFLTGLLNPSLTDRMVVLSHTPILVYHAHGDL